MVTKIQKWGNSLGVRIPRSCADEANVVAGSVVDVSVRNGVLVVRPVGGRKYRLADLLQAVKRSNLHSEVGSGKPAGREVW